ncbi:MAG: DUF2273 domain-containing protein [Clostridia bacterium]|nr:DUF2273 domain-containing protein [Clostridia bacterium]
MDRQAWQELLSRHRGKLVGALIGLAFALMTIWLGLWWTLFVWGCVLLGYLAGKHLDDEDATVADVLDRLLPPGRR